MLKIFLELLLNIGGAASYGGLAIVGLSTIHLDSILTSKKHHHQILVLGLLFLIPGLIILISLKCFDPAITN